MAFTIISANNTASTTTISDDAVIEAVLSSATAVSVSGDATVVANGSIIGFAASGNTVGVAGVPGTGGFAGITVEARGQGSHRTRVTGNTVRSYNQDGLRFVSGEDGAADSGVVSIDATVLNNSVAQPGPNVGAGLRFEMADPVSIVTACLDASGNQLAGSATIGTDLRVFHDFPGNTFRLPGYAGGAQDDVAVQNYLMGRNTATTGFVTTPGGGPGYVNGGAACAQPVP